MVLSVGRLNLNVSFVVFLKLSKMFPILPTNITDTRKFCQVTFPTPLPAPPRPLSQKESQMDFDLNKKSVVKYDCKTSCRGKKNMWQKWEVQASKSKYVVRRRIYNIRKIKRQSQFRSAVYLTSFNVSSSSTKPSSGSTYYSPCTNFLILCLHYNWLSHIKTIHFCKCNH